MVAALVLSDLVDGKEDGFLSASQIYSYKIGAGFVILSACNTGTPGAASGMSELASAFCYVGADQLMLTHWEIGSGVAVKLMTQFAIDFRVKESLPADSLRAAIDGILGKSLYHIVMKCWGCRCISLWFAVLACVSLALTTSWPVAVTL